MPKPSPKRTSHQCCACDGRHRTRDERHAKEPCDGRHTQRDERHATPLPLWRKYRPQKDLKNNVKELVSYMHAVDIATLKKERKGMLLPRLL